MSALSTYHKLLDLREQEKNSTYHKYQQAILHFEEIATQLYELLKQKEDTEEQFQHLMQESGVTAQYFSIHRQFIDRLDHRIIEMQPKVQRARSQMEQLQEDVTSAYIEVKKFEKLIENKVRNHQKQVQLEEGKLMDEMSMRQFLNYEVR
ncbi:flagellar export protein FliJ [Thalassobacillus sp. CUG 92003]|uniref:flagellar export protein FliJ n=1 Tax=Thalassobacillus sp. CUG 92003 TaxID=2736641 RepID=UPI0015E74F8E|nr:flagellar export protein FliJ [Thalassobacillus sp. CUG 92003]